MKNLKINISIIILLLLAPLHAQDSSFVKLKGQIDAYSGLNFSNPIQWETGARFIPSLSIGTQWKNNLKFDSELSFNSNLDYQFTDWKNIGSDYGLKPYRLWIRLSSKQFEIRGRPSEN